MGFWECIPAHNPLYVSCLPTRHSSSGNLPHAMQVFCQEKQFPNHSTGAWTWFHVTPAEIAIWFSTPSKTPITRATPFHALQSQALLQAAKKLILSPPHRHISCEYCMYNPFHSHPSPLPLPFLSSLPFTTPISHNSASSSLSVSVCRSLCLYIHRITTTPRNPEHPFL